MRFLAGIWPVFVITALSLSSAALASTDTTMAVAVSAIGVGMYMGWLLGEFKARFGVPLPFLEKE